MASFLTLGWEWVALPLIVAGLGIVLLLRGFGHFSRGNGGRGVGHLAIGTPLSLVGLGVALVALNTQSFARLTHENNVADVTIKTLDPAQQTYRVTIHRLDGPDQTLACDLQGDEWELSARVQKWKPWANVLGLDTTYTLDQIGNKYYTAGRGNGRTITACDLRGPEPLVDQWVPKSWLVWLVGQSYTEQRRFGSAAYMPLADGAVYRVVMTQAGLNAEPENDIARGANAARP
ncbi:MAG: hypothetical protein JOZ13_12860 [Alphaproteobacteria bacterium]|nr:hypothetical protein [Alphaproteobacteria bacterium]